MKIYDTHSQKLREFFPIEKNKIKMYVCGPTVYDFPHLGHARCYITWDVVARYLRFKGYELTYVRNITDVDDKIIKRASENNSNSKEIAEKYYDEFQKSMQKLNVAPPDIEPKATECIEDMIQIIKHLEEKGFAYAVNKDVYFRVGKFNSYGELGKQKLDDLHAGARVEASAEKESPLDFALWKSIKKEEEIHWESPWGKGRPGWHIECSAMIKKHLGEQIDIHAGGQDLIFPHHENEKAQSEAAFGKNFVNFWMHNGFVTSNSEKMSKSLGNFLTINGLLEKYDANTIRLFILTNHYRVPVEFSEDSLDAAKNGVKRLKNAYEDVKSTLGEVKINAALEKLNPLVQEVLKTDTPTSSEALFKEEIACIRNFLRAMDEDFNTSKALSVLFELANQAQKFLNSNEEDKSVFNTAILLKLSSILGFELAKKEPVSDSMAENLIRVLISVRKKAREEKNWAMSDLIRDQLANLKIKLKDKKDGTTTWQVED